MADIALPHIEHTAVHEAGHAVVAAAVGRPVVALQLVAGDLGPNPCCVQGIADADILNASVHPAGYFATELVSGADSKPVGLTTAKPYGSTSDCNGLAQCLHNFRSLFCRAGFSDQPGLEATVEDFCWEVLGSNWGAIQAVARAAVDAADHRLFEADITAATAPVADRTLEWLGRLETLGYPSWLTVPGSLEGCFKHFDLRCPEMKKEFVRRSCGEALTYVDPDHRGLLKVKWLAHSPDLVKELCEAGVGSPEHYIDFILEKYWRYLPR